MAKKNCVTNSVPVENYENMDNPFPFFSYQPANELSIFLIEDN